MKIAFRADASVQIGTGHVMRCLTLAKEMRSRGHDCVFICRDLPGHLGHDVTDAGFALTLLPAPDPDFRPKPDDPAHAAWAGAPWKTDAEQTRAAAPDVDWIIVDHYAFDARWQSCARARNARVMVIDDIADRPHIADLLLDQNLGRLAGDYVGLVPAHCTRLIGPAYVLMRPEFARLRASSLARRVKSRLDHILVSMGGVDCDNATSAVLDVLANSALPDRCRITVVMGRNAPWLAKVQRGAQMMPKPTDVVTDVADMASLMVSADLAIGGAGGTSWERCCLGLPSLLLVLADNQASAARAMDDANVAVLLGDMRTDDWQTRLDDILGKAIAAQSLAHLASGAIELLDGTGCAKCADELERSIEQ